MQIQGKQGHYDQSIHGWRTDLKGDRQCISTVKNYCATARFVKPYILEIRIHWVNSWAETKMRFEYQKGIMKITSMKLRLNEEDNWLVSRGEAIKEEER